MILVAGKLHVAPERREAYPSGCRDVIVAARAARGCLDFQLSADLLEPGRINVFEAWSTVSDVETFRG
jgi:quinol monooxygenase YgiN